MILKYSEYINETRISVEKHGKTLELNRSGRMIKSFSYMDDDVNKLMYFVLKSIKGIDKKTLLDNRITLLTSTKFKDTDPTYDIEDNVNRYSDIKSNIGVNIFGKSNDSDIEYIDNEIVDYGMILDDKRNYYLYQVEFADFRGKDRSDTVIVYDEDRFEPYVSDDGKFHYVLMERGKNISTVRLNNKQRHGSGQNAEIIISNRFGWELSPSKIKSSDFISVINNEKRIINSILKTDNDSISDLFKFSLDVDSTSTISKHDLVIKSNSNYDINDKKVEVKRYSGRSLYNRNKIPVDVLLAEQLKISTKPSLLNLVKVYGEVTGENIESLKILYDLDNGDSLSKFFNKNKPVDYINDGLIERIQKFYNDKIDILLNKYKNIIWETDSNGIVTRSNNRIMTDTYGIYFFNKDSGKDGFFVKMDNFEYDWIINSSHWGINRIQLMMKIKGDPNRFVWLGEEQDFIEISHKVSTKDVKPNDKDNTVNAVYNDEIIKIVWNTDKGYWERYEKNK